MSQQSPYKREGETVDVIGGEGAGDVGTSGDDKPLYQQKSWLYQNYVLFGRSTVEMSKDVDCSSGTIRYWLNKHGIETRDMSKAQENRFSELEKLRNEKWLREQYVEEGRSSDDIANELGCTPKGVRKRLHRYGIETRGPGQRQAAHPRLRNKEWMREKYCEDKLSLSDISDLLDVSLASTYRWMLKHDIDLRGRSNLNDHWVDKKSVPRRNGSAKGLVKDGGYDASFRNIEDRIVTGEWIPYRDEEWLREKYEEEGLSGPEIVARCSEMGCDVTKKSIYYWMDKFNIERSA